MVHDEDGDYSMKQTAFLIIETQKIPRQAPDSTVHEDNTKADLSISCNSNIGILGYLRYLVQLRMTCLVVFCLV